MNNEKGNVSILLVLVITFLLGMTALVVDIGLILVEQQKLSDALDSAALAGSQDLVNNPEKAKTIAIQYASLNGVNNPEVIINENTKEITVNGQKYVAFYFAKTFGLDGKTITGTAKAMVKPISSGTGFVPLGVVQHDFQYGKLYKLKYSSLDSENGNFGALALGGTGASIYKDNIMTGYQGELAIGTTVKTETGNMSGPTQSGIEYRLSLDSGSYLCDSYLTAEKGCNRVIYLPVIDGLNIDGRDEVTIVGFAAFYVENVSGNGNESFIDGRFIESVFPGDWGDDTVSDYGVYAAKLIY